MVCIMENCKIHSLTSASLPQICRLKKHKEGCQCAICVMMRRRQEREEISRMMGGQIEGSDDSLGEDIKPGVYFSD